MLNSKLQSEIQKNPTLKKLVNWRLKIDFIKNQVSKLEQLEDFTILTIVTFLLKCQILEFELKQLISSLDFHLFCQNSSRLFKKKVRTPRDLDDFTLGQLINEFDQFIGPTTIPISVKVEYKNGKNNNDRLGELKRVLKRLVNKRNEFTHRLLSSMEKDIKTLTKEAVSGIKDANKALALFENIEAELKHYET